MARSVHFFPDPRKPAILKVFRLAAYLVTALSLPADRH